MAEFTREQLASYLDDTLNDAETARVEQALRQSESLRKELRALLQESDRGEHSLGAIWRRHHLSCPTRDQLGSYLLDALEPDRHDYIRFHLETIGCAFCLANLADLKELEREAAVQVKQRRQRIFESSANHLKRV